MLKLRTPLGSLQLGGLLCRRGPTSAVYEGRLAKFGQVAIKLLNTDGRRGERSWEQWKFETERECARLFKGHNEIRSVVAAYREDRPPRGFDVPHGVWVLVYEYSEHTLREVLQANDRKLAPQQARSLLRRLAEGLHVLAKADVVHRDLKPENILIVGGEVSTAKIADFGVSLTPKNRTSAYASWRVGTRGYMAPELRKRPALATTRADVYSLACIAWECLSGRSPIPSYQADGEPDAMVPECVLRRGRRELENVDRVLRRALSRRPSERHASARALLRDLIRAGADDGLWPAPVTRSPRRQEPPRMNWWYADYRANGGALWFYISASDFARLAAASPSVTWRYSVGRGGYWTQEGVNAEDLLRRAAAVR